MIFIAGLVVNDVAPKDRDVAGFIGSPAMNLFRGRLLVDGRVGVDLGGGTILPLGVAPESMRNLRDRHVVVGLRPEDLQPENAETAAVLPKMRAEVEGFTQKWILQSF